MFNYHVPAAETYSTGTIPAVNSVPACLAVRRESSRWLTSVTDFGFFCVCILRTVVGIFGVAFIRQAYIYNISHKLLKLIVENIAGALARMDL